MSKKQKASEDDSFIHLNDSHHCIVPPREDGVYEGIAFAFPDCKTATDAFQGKIRRCMYHGTNEGNPTVRAFEKMIARGEGGRFYNQYDALATASGMSAIDLLTRHLALSSEQTKTPFEAREIVSSPYIYGGIYHYFANYLPTMGVVCKFVERPNDLDSWKQAISKRTNFLFLETPANPTSFV